MGSHIVNVENNLYKNRLNREGKILGKETLHVGSKDPGENDMNKYEEVKQQILDEEGCNIYGDVYVKKVPGNFHISSHAYGPIVSRLAQEGHYSWDLSHKINHFYVGDISDIDNIKKTFGEGVLSPLEDIAKIDEEKKVHEYYLKVRNL